MTWRRRGWGNSGVQGDGVSFLPYLLHQAGKLWCGHKMRELEIDDNIRSTHLHGLLHFQLPSFASLSAHVRNLHNPPSDGIHLLFRMGGKLRLPFFFTSRRFFLFLSLLGSSYRLFPVWKPVSLQLLLLPLLHSCCCFSSWEKMPEPQRKKPILPIPKHSKTSSSSSAQSACAFVLESVVVDNLETSKLRRQRQRRCHVDEMKTDEKTITHWGYCSLVCWGYATLHFGEADGERKEEKSMMVFNGALLLEFAGWAVEFCQVLACNPEVLGRSEVWDMLCCVPLYLLARAFRLLFSAFRVRLLPPPPLVPHNDWTSKNLLQLGSKQSRAFFSINFYFISLQQNSYLGFIVSSVQTLTIQIPSCFLLSLSLSNLYTQQQQLHRVWNESLAPDPILLLETSLSL